MKYDMEEWIKKLYVFIIKNKANMEDLRSYIDGSGCGEDLEWIEDDTFPIYDDDFRYGSVQRLIKHKSWLYEL